ncbi:hypothetical protein, partial [Desulfurella sp.]|uniref:hypothetical protein n=1 Tax=Desulfurella sp. TaxID=1962857 RepID=UPI00257ADAA1
MFFIVSTAAAAGLSRVSMGVSEATSSRYTIYSLVFLVSLYILFISQNKSSLYRHIVFTIASIISLTIFLYWIPNGIASLKYRDNLLNSSLVYPSEQRAINILETSMKLGVFFPTSQTYKYLPSFYATCNKINQITSYTIESVTLNNSKPLYNLSYTIQTVSSGNIPLPLLNNQTV